MSVDQFNDPSFKVLAQRIQENPEFAPLVKTAQLDPEEHQSLPSEAFAWPARRLYPYHTPEHAALSYLYASEKTASVPEPVLQTLRNALEVYDVKLPQVKTAAAPAEVDPNEYLLPELKRWRVTDASTVKLAEQALREYGKTLTVEQQASAAVRLVEKAASFGVPVDSSTERMAGLKVADVDTIRHWVSAREMVAPDSVKPMFAKVAEALESSEGVSQDRKALVKLASVIHDLDKQAGLDAMYGRKLPDPMTTVFNTEKRAEPTIDLNGKPVSLSKLAALPTHVYASIYGDDVLPEISSGANIDAQKLAQVLPTMPADLNTIFLKQVGPYLR